MNQNFNERLADIIRQKSLLEESQLRDALRDAIQKGHRLDNILIANRYLSESVLLPIVAEELSVPFTLLSETNLDPKTISSISAKYAHHFKILPIDVDDHHLKIAINNPQDLHLLDEISLAIGKTIFPTLASYSAIEDALKKYYGIGATTVEKLLDTETTHKASMIQLSEISTIDDSNEEASVISFVNLILNEAIRDGATDIHIEPFYDELKVRYRVDGILFKASVPPTLNKFQSAIISRIKIMANMDIAERRLPQDGRIKVKIDTREIDLRVSVLPTSYGETVNIRVLAQTDQLVDLEKLGLDKKNLEIVSQLIKKPHGIIFVTGPTGSGKSTTLYSCLLRLNNDERKILTIEDPIEYLIKGVSQMQISPKIGFNFGTALRSMLRHDPDVMMVGEVRDFETAEITIRVALTGHLVFSTLHTNDAPSAVTRLIDMDIEPFLIASSVLCFAAQRLVRKICPHCRYELDPAPEIKTLFEQDQIVIDKIYDGKGCSQCKFSGYKGRTGIFEFMVINDPIREAIMKRKSASEIKLIALKYGMQTLRQNGWMKVKQGITSIQEILRVTQEEEIHEVQI